MLDLKKNWSSFPPEKKTSPPRILTIVQPVFKLKKPTLPRIEKNRIVSETLLDRLGPKRLEITSHHFARTMFPNGLTSITYVISRLKSKWQGTATIIFFILSDISQKDKHQYYSQLPPALTSLSQSHLV